MTIRQRLTLWYSSLLISLITIFAIVAFGILDRTMRSQVDNNLLRVIDRVEDWTVHEALRTDSTTGEVSYTMSPNLETIAPADVYLQIWSVDESKYPFSQSPNLASHHAPLDPNGMQSHEVRAVVNGNDSRLRVISRPIVFEGKIVGYIQAASTMETVDSATKWLIKILALEILVALILSLVIGNWLARRALHPISNVTRTANQISTENDLSKRIPYDGPQDELGELITTFNHMVERLETLFNTERRFVADVSHELRTPITAIQGNVELLQRFGHDPASLKAIHSETQRMSRLVGDLLMLAQADVGHMPLIQTHVQLDSLLLEVYSQAKVLSKGHVRVIVSELDQIRVSGDPDRLKQLLMNLITNALAHTPENGEIRLTMQKAEKWVEIRVADTGVGISAEDLPHIFERFYRVDKSRSRDEGGVGLGLSIAKWIAEAHHGTLSAASTIGEGTTFTLRLPLPLDPEKMREHHAETVPNFPVIRLSRHKSDNSDPSP
ncbi:MAG: two-component sensor histidine kinase [Chloroflexota bacterium]|nr:sensor histidine kinase [Chloroflexota bacterium]NOG63511.1 HAMP domain-containing protein [Chloroflexota bacterium]GIK62778.1 MAG: two-component sensor histidine kinase [Chloroflexota bacterium]